MSTTKLANLINPEVMAQFINKKLTDAIKFAPLAEIGHELQGTPGDTLTMPVWAYIGDAEDLAEGVEGSVSQLTASTRQVQVKKAVKNVELTDEAVLSGLGNPIGQAELQLALSIANKVDNDCLQALRGATLKHEGAVDFDNIADALVLFGEDIEEASVIYVSPKQYASLRKEPLFETIANGQVKISGVVGQIMGVYVAVSKKVADTEAFIVRHGALGIELKRDVMVETERNMRAKKTTVGVDKHYVAYLKDDSKVIAFSVPSARAKK